MGTASAVRTASMHAKWLAPMRAGGTRRDPERGVPRKSTQKAQDNKQKDINPIILCEPGAPVRHRYALYCLAFFVDRFHLVAAIAHVGRAAAE